MKSPNFLKSFANKLRDDRKKEYLVYAALILTALIIFAASGGISCSKGFGSALPAAESGDRDKASSEKELEARLEAVLSCIKGAGEVKAMITFENCLERDAGSDSVAKTVIAGVIVVAEGADDIRVATELANAAARVLGVDISKVGVYRMRN